VYLEMSDEKPDYVIREGYPMASQTIAKILEAEQAAAQAVAKAEAEADHVIATTRQEAQQTLAEEAAKTDAAVETVAGQAQAEIARLNREAEQAAAARAQNLKQSALKKLNTVQELVISMIIPK
jgi:primosomal protein N'